MKVVLAGHDIDLRHTILFLGSGFSAGAINILDKNMLTGRGLRKHFLEVLNIDDSEMDIRNLADEIHESLNLDLYKIIYDSFTTKDYSNLQKSLIDRDWIRIYTTNYDDVVESIHQKVGRPINSFSYEDEIPAKIPTGAVIHLHGVVRNINRENVLDQLVLNEKSYVRQHFQSSRWYSEYVRDLKFCTSCIFIGYSLSDYHISALLMQNPSSISKVFFITKKDIENHDKRKLEKYGKVVPMGLEDFINSLSNFSSITAESDRDLFSLKHFRYVSPFRDKKTVKPPTAMEIINLIAFGSFNDNRVIYSEDSPEYIIPRVKLVDSVLNLIKTHKTTLIHSRIGNGKTIFITQIALKLSQLGFNVYIFRDAGLGFEDEIRTLCKSEKPIVIFDSYDDAYEYAPIIMSDSDTVKFVVSIRTSIYEVRLHEVEAKLPKPLHTVGINKLERQDLVDFSFLLRKAGIPNEFDTFRKTKEQELRDIVLQTYENKQIVEKIKLELEPLIKNPAIKSFLIISGLIRWLGHKADLPFIAGIIPADFYLELNKHSAVARDIFAIGDSDIEFRSSTFAEFAIQNFTIGEILDALQSIIVESIKRRSDRRYRSLLAHSMQISNIQRILRKKTNDRDSIVTMFEKLRRDIDINKEPLFWLQYSILKTSDIEESIKYNRPVHAEIFLESAYDRASKMRGFQTYQIDTHALRVYISAELAQSSEKISRFDKIFSVGWKVASFLDDVSHRNYAIEVIRDFENLIIGKNKLFSKEQKTSLMLLVSKAISSLKSLEPSLKSDEKYMRTLSALNRSKDFLLR